MIATWYAIAGLMLIIYVALDGRNFGAGMLHWLVARTPEERRQVIAAIGPLWSWHEVWLVGFGGTLLAVFPRLLASAFAGYYLALFLILWCLILRGIALEVGGHINDRMWQGFWDFVFVLANTLLAGLLATLAAAIFPIILHSTLAPENSLSAYEVAAGANSLAYAAIWWPIAFALATAYFVFVSRRYAGKVSVQRDNQGFY